MMAHYFSAVILGINIFVCLALITQERSFYDQRIALIRNTFLYREISFAQYLDRITRHLDPVFETPLCDIPLISTYYRLYKGPTKVVILGAFLVVLYKCSWWKRGVHVIKNVYHIMVPKDEALDFIDQEYEHVTLVDERFLSQTESTTAKVIDKWKV